MHTVCVIRIIIDIDDDGDGGKRVEKITYGDPATWKYTTTNVPVWSNGDVSIPSVWDMPKKEKKNPKQPLNNKHSIPVEVEIEDGKWKRYPSLMQAERETDISHSSISMACSGKRISAGGFRWRYARVSEQSN